MSFTLTYVFLAVMIVLVSLIIVYYMRNKNQERLRMIEKGINPQGDLSITEYRKQTNLRNGILIIALGLGLLIGHILTITIDKLDNFLTYFTMLLIFGGIGFLINYSILNKSGER